MNIRDSYIHGADGKGVVKSLFFVTAADVQADNNLHLNDLGIILADANNSTFYLTIPTLNLNTTGYAALILTEKKENNVNYYLTFVDSNNNSPTAESVYTNAGIYFNPTTGPTGHVGTLHVNNISGDNIGITIGNTFVALGGIYTPDTVISNTSTDNTIPSSKAVWDAILTGIQANDAMVFKGFLTGGADIDHTAYTPAAERGDTYKVSTAGWINGNYYQVNDTFICTIDSTAQATSSNVSTVKTNWGVVEGNGDYLSYNGGTMYGTLSWDGTTALPTVTTASSILVVDSNTTKQISLADLRNIIGLEVYVASAASGTNGKKQITAAQTDPYYNVIYGDTIIRSIQFKHGDNMSISSTTAGIITFTATNTWRSIYIGGSLKATTATNTKAMNFASSNLNINYLAAGTGTGKSGNDAYFTINLEAKNWSGATSSAAGTAGYMPGAASADRTKFLRGDGSWIALAPSISAGTTDTNKIKIKVGGENSSEFTVPYATNSDTIDGYHANKITDIYFGSWCLGYDTGTYYGKVAEFAYTSTGTMNVSATFLISKYTSSAVNGSANILNIKARATSTTDITCKATWALCTENNIPITITTLKDGNNYYIRIYLESKGWDNVYGCKLLSSHRWATSNMTSWTLYSGSSLSTITIQYFNSIPASETVVPISISNIGVINNAATIGRDLTTIATVSGVDITAKIASYVLTAGDTMTGNLTRSIANYTRGTAPSSRKVAAYSFVDSENTTSGWIEHVAETNGQTSLGFYIVTPKSPSDSTNVYKGFSIIKPSNVDYGAYNMTFNIGSGQLTVPAPEGTKPLIISSTTLNTNLNADLLDGYHASDFIQVATELVSVSKTLKVDTWTNMATIDTYTGTYAIQINSGNVYASGVFTACGGTDSVIDEIPLHVADKGTNTWRPYARISGTKLQMTTNEATGTARTYKIKIVKLI